MLIKNLLTLDDFKDLEFSVEVADWRIVESDDANRTSGLSQATASVAINYEPEPSNRTKSADLPLDIKRKIVEAYDHAPKVPS